VNFIQSLFIGILQGLTEFFPISSSAHLKLFKLFFNISQNQNFHLLDLSCHLGTLVVTTVFLKDEIKKLIFSKKNLSYIFLAIIPLVPIYFFSKNIRVYFSQDKFLAFFLFLTAFFLFLISFLEKKNLKIKSTSKIKDVLLIGIMQSFALLPGISRSASTITAANIRGWKLEDSIKFSYLLSIPTILGGSILEAVKEIKHTSIVNEIPLSSYVISFLSSLIVGFFAIKIIFSIKDAKKLKYFGYYLVLLGVITLFFINF
jgi:undecaprenyl-diphosphatase